MRQLHAYVANESTRRLVEDGMSAELTNKHTACGFSVLYHVFARKQRIACSALRHQSYLTLPWAPCKRTKHCWPITPKIVGCYMLRPFAHPVTCCWILLRVVAQSLKPVKLFSQQLPTFLLFCDRQSVAQQCWIRLHSSSFTGEKCLIGRRATTWHCQIQNGGNNPIVCLFQWKEG